VVSWSPLAYAGAHEPEGRRVEQFAERGIEPGDGQRHQPREVLSPGESVIRRAHVVKLAGVPDLAG